MNSEIVHPYILTDVATTLRNEADLPYFGLIEKPVPQTPDELEMSIAQFTSTSRTNISEFMEHFKKTEKTSPHNFILESIRNIRTGQGTFVLDGFSGFALCVNLKDKGFQKKPICVGLISLRFGKELEKYPFEENSFYSESVQDFTYPYPEIVQIQGYRWSTFTKDKASYKSLKEIRQIMEEYKWERALIGVVLEWTRQANIPAVYLLPGNRNRWLSEKSSEDKKRKFHMRYDVSAKRAGFKMQSNGLYGISTANYKNEQIHHERKSI